VLLATFLLTVLVDLTVALQVGMVLSAFLFMRRMAEVTNVQAVTRQLEDGPEEPDAGALSARVVPRGVEVYEIDGPFFFGAAERFKEALGEMGQRPKVLIIRLRKVPVIDATGLSLLRELHVRCQRQGTQLVLSGVQPQPRGALERAGLLEEIGTSRIAADLDEALAIAGLLVHQFPTPARGTPVP